MQQKLCSCQQSWAWWNWVRADARASLGKALLMDEQLPHASTMDTEPQITHFGAGKWSRRRVRELKVLQIELHIGIIMAAILRSCLITLNWWQAEIITLPPPRSWGLFLPYSHPTVSSCIFAFSLANYRAPKALEQAGNRCAQGEKTRHKPFSWCVSGTCSAATSALSFGPGKYFGVNQSCFWGWKVTPKVPPYMCGAAACRKTHLYFSFPIYKPETVPLIGSLALWDLWVKCVAPSMHTDN